MAFHDKTATQVTNIVLNVRDLDLMTTFYKNILGLSVKSSDDNTTGIICWDWWPYSNVTFIRRRPSDFPT